MKENSIKNNCISGDSLRWVAIKMSLITIFETSLTVMSNYMFVCIYRLNYDISLIHFQWRSSHTKTSLKKTKIVWFVINNRTLKSVRDNWPMHYIEWEVPTQEHNNCRTTDNPKVKLIWILFYLSLILVFESHENLIYRFQTICFIWCQRVLNRIEFSLT